MKKSIKLYIVFMLSFVLFSSKVLAEGVCTSKVTTDTYYNKTGWDAYVYVCNAKFSGEYATSACEADEGTASKFCEGTYHVKGYKGSHHSGSFVECDSQNIFKGITYTVTCKYGLYCSKYTDTDKDGVRDNDEECDGWSYRKSYTTTKTVTPSECGNRDCSDSTDRPNFESACSASYGDYNFSAASGTSSGNCYQAIIKKYKCDPNDPKKYLVENVREVKYSVDGENGNSIPVYCVNPSAEGISETFDGGNNANRISIDATKCVNSFSDPNCGYANIMIEGYYRNHYNPSTKKIEKTYNNSNYDYAVIGAAMRLWGAHWGDGGFDDTGIADEDNTTCGDECENMNAKENGKWLMFVPKDSSGKYLNVFTATVKQILTNTLYSVTTNMNEIDSNRFKDNSVKSIKDVACNESRMGNFCGTSTGQSHGNNRYMYAIALYVNTIQGNDKMQDHLNEINGMIYGEDIFTSSSPEGAYVEIDDKEHLIRVEYRLDEDVEIDCNTLDEDTANDYGCKMEQKIVFKDATGKDITKEYDVYDYCKKNYCYKEIQLVPGTVTCDIASGIKVYARIKKKCGSESVKKYVSCGNPNGAQIMFSFEPDPWCKEENELREVPWIETNCGGKGCTDVPSASPATCTEDSISSSLAETTVNDPSLSCILNKQFRNITNNPANSKGYYDYSEMFGVNTNFCRVYCSDKVTYYMAQRQDVDDGFQLKYDIESRVFGTNKSEHALTSVIKVKRDCVSEIYYENNFDLADKVDEAYGFNLDDDNSDGSIRDWKKLYEKVLDKSFNENDRKEVLNQLIYDLYACNFISEEKMPDSISRPKDSKDVYSNAKKIFESTKSYCENNDCVTGSVTYDGGAEYITKTNGKKYTGTNGVDPALSTDNIPYNSFTVKYCSNGKCFYSQNNGPYTDKLSEAGSSKFTTVKFGKNGSDVKIPTNDYAVFSYEVDSGLYNSTIYQVEEYTGKISVVQGTKDDKMLTLNNYVYPVANSVQNICRSVSKNTYLCDINLTINVPLFTNSNNKNTAFIRNFANNDQFIKKLGEAKNYSCVYGVKRDNTCPPTDPNYPDCIPDSSDGSLGFIFRNIDLKDPVPNSRKNSKGELLITNWEKNNTSDPDYAKYVSQVISEIKDSGEDGMLYASDYYLEYSYVLDANSIEAIRDYNESHSYFENVVKNSCEIKNGLYVNCNSKFLSELHADNNQFSVEVKKSDGVSEFTKEKLKNGGTE